MELLTGKLGHPTLHPSNDAAVISTNPRPAMSFFASRRLVEAAMREGRVVYSNSTLAGELGHEVVMGTVVLLRDS